MRPCVQYMQAQLALHCSGSAAHRKPNLGLIRPNSTWTVGGEEPTHCEAKRRRQ